MSPEAITKQFGRNVAEARSWAGLSQTDLGKLVSMKYEDIGKIERGARSPRLELIVKLAEALELQVRDLLYGIE